MTFRQILVVLWRGIWLILALAALAVVAAAMYLQQQEPSYTSTATVRTNPFIADTILTGSLGGIPVDLSSDVILTPTVLDAAAALAGGGATGAGLASTVTFEVEEAVPTEYIYISATAGTADQAQRRANAVAQAYGEHLTQQIDAALVTVEERRAAALDEANNIQAQLSVLLEADIPQSNQVLESTLSRALLRFDELTLVVDGVAAAGPPLTVISPAAPGEADGLDPLIVFGTAIAAALIAGIGILLIRDQFDDRLRGEHEVERLTGVTSLGTLPNDRKAARDEALPLASGRPTAFSEGVRALRSSLQVLVTSQTSAAIVITSVEPGDGKTFVSTNLALAWARVGKRVILVEGDLRRPRFADYFGDDVNGRGLSDLLRAAARSGNEPTGEDVQSLLKDTQHPDLRILPAGSPADDPADLLGTTALGTIVGLLREHADIVVIDTPPAMGLADAGLFESHADGVVILASEGRTLRASLVATVGALEASGANMLGIVVNRSKSRVPRSYTAYYSTSSEEKTATSTARTDDIDDLLSPDVDTDAAPRDQVPTQRRRLGGGVAAGARRSRSGPSTGSASSDDVET